MKKILISLLMILAFTSTANAVTLTLTQAEYDNLVRILKIRAENLKRWQDEFLVEQTAVNDILQKIESGGTTQ